MVMQCDSCLERNWYRVFRIVIFGGFLSINFTPLSTEVTILSTLFVSGESPRRQRSIDLVSNAI